MKKTVLAITLKDLLPNKGGKKMTEDQVIKELIKMGIWDPKARGVKKNDLVKAYTAIATTDREKKLASMLVGLATSAMALKKSKIKSEITRAADALTELDLEEEALVLRELVEKAKDEEPTEEEAKEA
jgi:hypothetical protein